MNKYKIIYFDYHTHSENLEIVSANTAADAHYCWETANSSAEIGKRFNRIECLESDQK